MFDQTQPSPRPPITSALLQEIVAAAINLQPHAAELKQLNEDLKQRAKLAAESFSSAVNLILQHASQAELIRTVIQQTAERSFNYIPLAVFSELNILKALKILVRFYNAECNLFVFSLNSNSKVTTITAKPSAVIDAAGEFILQIIFAIITSCKNILAGGSHESDIIRLVFNENTDNADYARVLSCPVEHNSNSCTLTYATQQINSELDLTTVAFENSERIEQLKLELSHSKHNYTLQAVATVFSISETVSNSKQVAQILFISERTLRRKLAESNNNFQAILNNFRTQLAARLLINSKLSVAEISQRLGFSDSSNFIKAFKKATTTTPATYRREHQ